MPLTKQDKEKQVLELTGKIQKSCLGVLVDYCGLTVEEVTDLRKQLRGANVDYTVYKNSVLRFASNNNGLNDLATYLDGPNAIALSESDPVSPAKILVDFAKAHDKLKIKSGFIDGKIVSAEEIVALSALPSKEELLAKILGGFNAPVSGLANVLQATVRSLVYVLNAYAEKQQEA